VSTASRRDAGRPELPDDRRSRRDRLVAFIEALDVERDEALSDDASLITSGFLDSLALFNLAAWIEGETGSTVDFAEVELWREWDTITGILRFIERRRAGEGRAG
jgi:acyl carrier protein